MANQRAAMTSIAAFPESRFAAPPRLAAAYRARVRQGRAVMQGQRAVICGLARDLAHVLPSTIARIERLGAMFADYRVVVYENDSVDATGAILSDWQQRNSRIAILSECCQAPVNPVASCLRRAARMAYYRNRCRDFLQANTPDFDVAIVVDMDLDGGWSYDGVANTFGHEGWDFVGSYGIIERSYLMQTLLVQYDAWAFRTKGSYARIPTKTVNHMRFSRGDAMLPVYSCFGGLGVYRMQAMLTCRYDGSDCEHVCFHRRMREAGLDRLYLNPSQVTFYGHKPNNLVRAYRRLTGTRRRRAA